MSRTSKRHIDGRYMLAAGLVGVIAASSVYASDSFATRAAAGQQQVQGAATANAQQQAQGATGANGQKLVQVAANANALQHQAKADTLNQLRLFQGTSAGYELDQPFTRAQGAVMLLRLLGLEDDAQQAAQSPVFADSAAPYWAAPYVAFTHQKGLVRGVSETAFAPDAPMTGAQFITLTLRALGYAEAEPEQASALAVTAGLLSGEQAGQLTGKTHFLRDDMVAVAYYALTTRLKSGEQTLIEKLVDTDGAVNRELALQSGLYSKPASNDPLDHIEAALRRALNESRR
ncbi:S-layer homology domain-containing protein [Paenibacillus sp. YYML68]|uniref:S-layer homology domain-containing protein n=1 Tax=Paenibacillus sp. YYML68 TaxID=2909250 RepID=UPI00248FDBE0|nr:S-layer homology domain-containing protein [Paenibacillus sp. YYML68]